MTHLHNAHLLWLFTQPCVLMIRRNLTGYQSVIHWCLANELKTFIFSIIIITLYYFMAKFNFLFTKSFLTIKVKLPNFC